MELELDYNLLIHKGLVRERNEDRCVAFEPEDAPLRRERGRLFILADGMGGHAAGDVAAELGIQAVQQAYYTAEWTGAAAQLRSAFRDANQRILDAARGLAGNRGMGAAIVAVAVIDKQAFVAHLGDCRAYLVRGGAALPLTDDHSWVRESVAAGRMSAETARSHPYRNMLTRALGADLLAEPDVNSRLLTARDALVLCSDGLWGLVESDDIARLVYRAEDSAAAVQALVDLALQRGGHDNVSVIVVRVTGPTIDAETEQIVLPPRSAPGKGRSETD